MLSATAWNVEAAKLNGSEAITFPHPTKQLSRTFCSSCGDTVFGTNRLGMRVVPNGLVARATGGILPEHFQPTMHLFYRQRIIDVTDTLTKFLDGWDGSEYKAPGSTNVYSAVLRRRQSSAAAYRRHRE